MFYSKPVRLLHDGRNNRSEKHDFPQKRAKKNYSAYKTA